MFWYIPYGHHNNLNSLSFTRLNKTAGSVLTSTPALVVHRVTLCELRPTVEHLAVKLLCERCSAGKPVSQWKHRDTVYYYQYAVCWLIIQHVSFSCSQRKLHGDLIHCTSALIGFKYKRVSQQVSVLGFLAGRGVGTTALLSRLLKWKREQHTVLWVVHSRAAQGEGAVCLK